jgi:hypothetical protein
MNNSLITQKIENFGDDTQYSITADELIRAIDKTLNDFTVEAIAAGREYSDYKMNQCIAVNITGSSLFNELKMIVVFAFVTYISALAYDLSRKFRKA